MFFFPSPPLPSPLFFCVRLSVRVLLVCFCLFWFYTATSFFLLCLFFLKPSLLFLPSPSFYSSPSPPFLFLPFLISKFLLRGDHHSKLITKKKNPACQTTRTADEQPDSQTGGKTHTHAHTHDTCTDTKVKKQKETKLQQDDKTKKKKNQSGKRKGTHTHTQKQNSKNKKTKQKQNGKGKKKKQDKKKKKKGMEC
ncbi:hypothetical protein TCDM_00993 [Trypanosoma cruzi Dm28c]|uniref:Uncharacterized protein n=1 Tax=Trypanosoma cruzi Dm28c TaxID=1416333 RepID=V5C084_TRYCR|nr:hypothetical protein TCDM_00993 [Trypanosoma cruzi Dm28c]